MGLHQEVWRDTQLQGLRGRRAQPLEGVPRVSLKEAADAAATSAALQEEAATSPMHPRTTIVAGVDPMHVELLRDKAVPATITGGSASSSAGPAGPVRRRDHPGDLEAQRT